MKGSGSADDILPQHPETRLALGYAPETVRPVLNTMFAFDERLAAVAVSAREPALAAIRLQWWHDALGNGPVPGEPMLAALTGFGIAGDLQPLAAHWGDWLEGDADAPGRCGMLIFARAATALSPHAPLPDDIDEAGRLWGLVRLSGGARPQTEAALLTGRWPRALLPLRLLARLSARRLSHPDEPTGGRARLARLAWWAMTNG